MKLQKQDGKMMFFAFILGIAGMFLIYTVLPRLEEMVEAMLATLH